MDRVMGPMLKTFLFSADVDPKYTHFKALYSGVLPIRDGILNLAVGFLLSGGKLV